MCPWTCQFMLFCWNNFFSPHLFLKIFFLQQSGQFRFYSLSNELCSLEYWLLEKPLGNSSAIRAPVGANNTALLCILITNIINEPTLCQCATTTMLVEHRRHALVVPVGIVLQQQKKQQSSSRISELLSCFDCSICLSTFDYTKGIQSAKLNKWQKFATTKETNDTWPPSRLFKFIVPVSLLWHV